MRSTISLTHSRPRNIQRSHWAFVHIPKTGGSSVRSICHKNLIAIIDHDLRSPTHVSAEEYYKRFFSWDRRIGRIRTVSRFTRRKPASLFSSRVATEIRLALGPSCNPPIFSFCIVRNPWDRVVSAFHYLCQGGMNSDDLTDYENHLSRYRGNFRDFVLYGLNSPEVLSQIHFRPQVEWIRSQDGALIPDFIGKTETLDDSMRSLAKLLGVDHTPVSIRNQSAHQDYRDYYNDKMIDLVASAYAEDVDTFGYAFDRKLSRQSEFSN